MTIGLGPRVLAPVACDGLEMKVPVGSHEPGLVSMLK